MTKKMWMYCTKLINTEHIIILYLMWMSGIYFRISADYSLKIFLLVFFILNAILYSTTVKLKYGILARQV